MAQNVITEPEAVTLADIPMPSAQQTLSKLRTPRYKDAVYLFCESHHERQRMDIENRMQVRAIGENWTPVDTAVGHKANNTQRFLALRTRQFHLGRTAAANTIDVICRRCSNAGRLFYVIDKPGEFTYEEETESWLCSLCKHVEALDAADPAARLLSCPMTSINVPFRRRWKGGIRRPIACRVFRLP